MSTPQRAPRSRSAFAAAFLSLLFPGLGHAYAGAYTRALGFAAAPLLVLALGGGVVLRADRAQLAGMVANEGALIAIFIANIVALVYRVIAAVDAWQVARFLNATDASGGGRLGRARMPVHPLSIAGLAAVILVIGAGHFAVGRYDALAYGLVTCVFNDDGGDTCGNATDPPTGSETQEPGDSADPGASDGSRRQPDSGDPHARPVRPGHARSHPAAVGRQGAAEHPRGRHGRPGGRRHQLQHRHPDRGLDRPRDQAGRDVPGAARHGGRARPGECPLPVGLRVRRQDQQLVQPEPQPEGPVAGQDRPGPRPQLAQGHPRQALRPGHPLPRHGGLRGLQGRREHRRRRPGQRADAGLREPVPRRRGLPHPALHPRRSAAHDRRRGAPATRAPAIAQRVGTSTADGASSASCSRSRSR